MRIHTSKYAAVALLALTMSATTASADENANTNGGPNISASLTGATDYIFRGVSQTSNNPAIFASLNAGFDNGFYIGAGVENVDFGNSVDAEYDIWIGWSGALGDFGLNLQAVRFGYVNTPDGVDLDTYEFKAGLSRQFDKLNIGASANYTPDYFAVEQSAVYYEATASYQMSDQWSLSAALGKQTISESQADYGTWNIGTSYNVTDTVTLDARYYDTDVSAGGAAFNDHFVLSFKLAL